MSSTGDEALRGSQSLRGFTTTWRQALSRSAAGYVFVYEPKAMSSPMSVRLGDQSRSLRVLSEDRRLFSDRLIPDAALGGGVNEPPMFATVSASMPSICSSERLSVC